MRFTLLIFALSTALSLYSCADRSDSAEEKDLLMNAMLGALQAASQVAPEGSHSSRPSQHSETPDDPSIAQKLLAALTSVDGSGGGGGSSDSSGQHRHIDAPPSRSMMTSEFAQQILDGHNRWRSLVARGLIKDLPCAANLPLLEWDDRLASAANDWARQCQARPESPCNCGVTGLTCIGQSVAADWLPEVKAMVDRWFNQRRNFDPVGGGCRGEDRTCSGFRLLVSASARLVGCALQECRGSSEFATLLVCNYAGLGDVWGGSGGMPYAHGAVCRSCPRFGGAAVRCLQGLCAAEAACEAAARRHGRSGFDACADAPCTDDAACASMVQDSSPAELCRSQTVSARCPRLCNTCDKHEGEGHYRPKNVAQIEARVDS